MQLQDAEQHLRVVESELEGKTKECTDLLSEGLSIKVRCPSTAELGPAGSKILTLILHSPRSFASACVRALTSGPLWRPLLAV